MSLTYCELVRRWRGLSQTQLALSTEPPVSQAIISRIEQEAHVHPTMLRRVAQPLKFLLPPSKLNQPWQGESLAELTHLSRPHEET